MKNLLPRLIQTPFLQGIDTGVFPAVGLFADISGFTVMTEALMRHGKIGAEELAHTLTQVFDPLVQAIHAHGGDIVSFAGDAFTAVFPIEGATAAGGETPHLRALSAAVALQQALAASPSRTTPHGTFPFAIKLGLADGLVSWRILRFKSGAGRCAYVFRGPGVEACASAEHRAGRGDLVLSAAVHAAVAAAVEAEAVDTGHLRVTRVVTELPSPGPVEPWLADPDALRAFFPPEVIQAEARGEFRWVVTVFLGVPESLTEEQLSELMERVHELQGQFEGCLSGVDFGDKGCNLLLFWGAPVGFENDVERALHFALRLRELSPVPLRAGVTRFLMYAGFAGATDRAAYSCYGRGVNLAARLMTRAPWGEVWLDERTVREGGSGFSLEVAGSFELKGFDRPQAVWRLRGRAESGPRFSYQGRMIGREAELEQLGELVAPLFRPHPEPAGPARTGCFAGALVVYGEPGIGKSRLVHHFRQELATQQDVDWLDCPSDELSAQPLQPFRRFVRSWSGQTSTQSEQHNAQQFEVRLRKLERDLGSLELPEAPAVLQELLRTAPALAVLADRFEAASAWEQLDPQLRFENLVQAFKNLVTALSLFRPVILFLDDIQWLDADSQKLLQALTRNVERIPLAVLATARLADDGTRPRLLLAEDVPCIELVLEELGIDPIREIAEQVTGGHIPPQWVQFLAAKTAGNPFFAEQLALHLVEQGWLGPQAATGFEPGAVHELPATITGVLIARLDRLSVPVKHVVQTAAVLGFEFERPVLQHMLGQDPELDERLRSAARAAVWSAVTDLDYIFRHNLMRDAAYEMQLRSRLRDQHHLAAQAFEALYPVEAVRPFGKLALHYGRAEIPDRWLHYLEKAADAARDSYANDAAIRDYRKVLEASPDATVCIDVAVKLAQVLLVVGQLGPAAEVLAQARDGADRAGDGRRQAAALAVLGQVYWRQSRHDEALSVSAQAADLAREAGAWSLQSEALRNIGIVHDMMRHPDRALDELKRALEASERSGDQAQTAKVLNSLGVVSWGRGDREACLAFHRRALAIHEQMQNRNGMALSKSNIGVLFREAGRLDEARHAYDEALGLFREVGSKSGTCRTLFNLGNLHRYLGDSKSTLPFYEQAVSLAREIGERAMLCQALYNLAASLAETGRPQQARVLNLEVLALTGSLGWDDFELASRILEQKLQAATDREAAISALLELRSRAPRDPPEWTTALAEVELWRLTGDELYRQSALELYPRLFERTGRIEYIWSKERLEAEQLGA